MRYLGLVAVALSACVGGGQVNIAPLPPEPSPQQRVALWEMYRPHGNVDEIVTICNRNGGCERTEQRLIIFGDGRRVRDPEDLAPLVPPESETVKHTRRAQQYASRANLWAAGGLIAVAGGLVMLFSGNSNAEVYGIGAIVLGSVVGGWGQRVEARNARNAASEAFAAYPNDLANRLGVCANGLAVVPCEAPETVTAPGATPAPAPPR